MVVPATIISTAIGAINGYMLSKWRFRGLRYTVRADDARRVHARADRAAALGVHLGKLGLTNSTSGLVLVHCVQGLSFTTLFCRNYYINIPDDLIKAARIDGAGFWRIFRKIILPLSPPILIVTVIWQFTSIWNEFLFAVIFTSGQKQPITAALIALSAGGTIGASIQCRSGCGSHRSPAAAAYLPLRRPLFHPRPHAGRDQMKNRFN